MSARLRTLLAAVGGVLVLAGAVPASAGTGASQACSDHTGYQEIPVNNGIVTIGAELVAAPGSLGNAVIVCFSNTTPGVPSTAVGGAIWVFFGTNGSTSAPSVYVNTVCADDLGSQTLEPTAGSCTSLNGVTVSLTATTVLGSFPACFVKIGSVCSPVTPPVGVPVPQVTVTVLGVPVTV